MAKTVIQVSELSKIYDLGLVGTGTLSKDLNRFWAKMRGKPDPYATLAELNDRTQKTKSGVVYALKEISFSVEQGEVLGIIGKNGAGKSTLLKILSQITSPSSGDIRLRGRVASLLEVGTGMHPEMTARQNIYLNGAILGMRRWEITRKLDDIVEFAGIGKYIDTPIKRFSSGMQVRLGFAVAAFLEPEILIVDEVLAVGDAEFQKRAVGKMKEVSKGGGRTVLFVSHNMASVKNLCQKAMVIKDGGLHFMGGVNEGVNKYLNTNEASNNSLNLKDREDRKTKGSVRFSRINFISPGAGVVDSILVGNDLTIEVFIEAEESISLIGVRLLIKDNAGVIRSVLNGAFVAKFPVVLNEKENKFSFHIPKFPFPEGSYSIDLACFSNEGIEDDISNAAFLACEAGDFYGVGRLPSVKDGVLIDYEFYKS